MSLSKNVFRYIQKINHRKRLLSSEDWAIGDMAECISSGIWFHDRWPSLPAPGPKKGEVRVVRGLLSIGSSTGLRFERWPYFYLSSCFRKITPRADEAECSDGSFKNLVKRNSRPRRYPLPEPPALKPKRKKEEA